MCICMCVYMIPIMYQCMHATGSVSLKNPNRASQLLELGSRQANTFSVLVTPFCPTKNSFSTDKCLYIMIQVPISNAHI